MTDVKKKIRPGKIELDPEDCAIIVHYEVEATVLDDSGNVVASDKKPSEKKIKVKTLNQHSNISALAQDIIDKCKLISKSKLRTVEDLLYELQRRETDTDYREQQNRDMEILHRRNLEQEKAMEDEMQNLMKQRQKEMGVADINELDTYLEQLYEEMDEKVKATYLILQLARRTQNLDKLLSHATLLGALARVLREDGKKSLDLAINIISIFFAFSNFSQFHNIISEQGVGNLTLLLLELELKRMEARAKAEGEASVTMMVPEPGKPLTEKQKKNILLNRKQERLMFVSTYLLLNLSEDINIEKKIKKKNIVVFLVSMLDRRSVELLILVCTFLKKLSIYGENKEKMAECHVVKKLCRLVPCQNDALLMMVLRLLINLTFDPTQRDEMVKCGIIPKAVELMKVPQFNTLVMGLFYQLSLSDQNKSLFTFTDALPMILNMLVENTDTYSQPELIALAVNLTTNPRNAEVIIEGEGLELLLNRAMRLRDSLVFKVVRNISQHEELKTRFEPYIHDMLVLLRAPETDSELLVEVLGTLGNLTMPEFGLEELITEFDLLRFMGDHLNGGVVEDDIVLEVVIFCGTLCNENLAAMIAEAGIVEKMYHLMSEKKEDDEMVLQITYAFSRFLMFEETREVLLRKTQVVYYFADLLQDKNPEVRKIADRALDFIIELDDEWALTIRKLKYELYNQEWLEAIDADGGHNDYAEGEVMSDESYSPDNTGMRFHGERISYNSVGGQR
eukprot:jgi/Mesvir1/471/Mv11346-RA.1